MEDRIVIVDLSLLEDTIFTEVEKQESKATKNFMMQVWYGIKTYLLSVGQVVNKETGEIYE